MVSRIINIGYNQLDCIIQATKIFKLSRHIYEALKSYELKESIFADFYKNIEDDISSHNSISQQLINLSLITMNHHNIVDLRSDITEYDLYDIILKNRDLYILQKCFYSICRTNNNTQGLFMFNKLMECKFE